MRSGFAELATDFLWGSGVLGFNWSGVAGSNGGSPNSAYYLRLGKINLEPSLGPRSRSYGFPVRCLASGVKFPRVRLETSYFFYSAIRWLRLVISIIKL